MLTMLYDSDNFLVVNHPPDSTQETSGKELGFEIVDKRNNMEVYLTGDWASIFYQQILAWQQNTPTQEQVESVLDSYSGLVTHSLQFH